MKKFVALLVLLLGVALADGECYYSNESNINQTNFTTDPGDVVDLPYNAVNGHDFSRFEAYRVGCFYDAATPLTFQTTRIGDVPVLFQLSQGGHTLDAYVTDETDLYQDVYPDFVVEDHYMYVLITLPPDQWDAPAGQYTGTLVYQVSYF